MLETEKLQRFDQLLVLVQEQAAMVQAQQKHNEELVLENKKLQRQIAWFQRQLFGRKSEKREFDLPLQEDLKGLFDPLEELPEPKADRVEVPAHTRKKKLHPGTPADSGLRFDASQVPMKDILLSCPELDGPDSGQYEIIRYEHTYRLAMHRSSYEVLRFMRPVLKRKGSDTLITPPAPDNVFGKSFADVSFVAGMLVDKFIYHQPLYRQHQKLKASYIEISRATLTHLTEKAALLLEPVAKAVLDSILQSALIAMDETPSKAGRTKKAGAKHGKMRQGWFWPLYGDKGEIYFHFSPSRGTEVVRCLLENFSGTLLSDGYSAYASYTEQNESVTHALFRVEEDVTALNPHRPGRAQLTHPVPHNYCFAA